MIPQILFSLLLILFTSIAFVFLYRNIASQQKLAVVKNEFISNVTHELKTPIATVQVAVEALKNFNAIDEVFLSFNFQVFVFICIASFALVLLTSRLTNDVAKFERTNAQLGKYFSPSIRKEIERLDVDINKRPNKTQMIGIIFTDIIGFTKISEKLEPAEVLELLSEYQKK